MQDTERAADSEVTADEIGSARSGSEDSLFPRHDEFSMGSELSPEASSQAPAEPAHPTPAVAEPSPPRGQPPPVVSASADDPDPESQELLDPVHQYIRFSRREMEVIDHPAFQRLFRIQQLGQTSLVYRGATHNRGLHALGALHAVTLLCDAINRRVQATGPDHDGWALGPALDAHEITFARLAALLHDIGHIAAGHTLEDELGILELHDANARLNLVLDRPNWGGTNITESDSPVGETLRERIDRLFRPEANTIGLRYAGDSIGSAAAILLHLISKDHSASDPRNYEGHGFRVGVVRDLVGNTLCADLLDYIHRDWHYIGKPRHFDQRILHYTEVRQRRGSDGDSETARDAVVVNLVSDKAGRYRTDAVTSIASMLDSRYELWETALLHRTKTAAAAMLERAIGELVHTLGFFDNEADRVENIAEVLLESLLEATDHDVYRILGKDIAASPMVDVDGFKENPTAKDLLWRVGQRILHKQVITITTNDAVSPDAVKRVARLFAPSRGAYNGQPITPAQRRQAAKSRLEMLRALEDDFGLERGSLAMYCSPYGMGQKLAEVQVLHHGGVSSLSSVDETDRISGGQLEAQMERFNHLWRASLFAAPEAMHYLGERHLVEDLGDAFQAALHVEDRAKSVRSMSRVALRLHSVLPELYGDRLVRPDYQTAARLDIKQLAHPSGIPTITAFFDYDE